MYKMLYKATKILRSPEFGKVEIMMFIFLVRNADGSSTAKLETFIKEYSCKCKYCKYIFHL